MQSLKHWHPSTQIYRCGKSLARNISSCSRNKGVICILHTVCKQGCRCPCETRHCWTRRQRDFSYGREMLISLRKWSLQVVLMQESSDNHSPPHFQNEFCHFWLVNTNTKAQFMDKKRRRRSLLLHQYRKIICLQSACCQHYDHKDSQSCVKTREQIFMVLPIQNKWGSTCERDRWWWKVLSQTLALATADWTEFEWGRQHAAVRVVQNLRNEDRSPADEIAVDSQERLQTFLQNLIYLQLYYRQGFQYRKQRKQS